MKNLALFVICFMILSGCKNKTTKATTESNTTKIETKKKLAKIEDFECDTFFKKGDYSSMCFTDSKLPEYIGRGCIFDFITNGNKQEQSIKVQLTSKSSAMLAEMAFNLSKSNYKKGKTTHVSNLGDDAFFDVHGTDLKSLSRSHKDLHVRYKNIVFVIMAEYMSNKGTPCFYSNKDLTVFAKTIILNL